MSYLSATENVITRIEINYILIVLFFRNAWCSTNRVKWTIAKYFDRTSVITDEDCKNQVIQDALNVSCDEEMNNLLAKITGDFSLEKEDNEESSKVSEENKPHFSLQFEEM